VPSPDPFAPPDLSAPPVYGAAHPYAPSPPYGPGPPGGWVNAPYQYADQQTNGLAIAALILGLVGVFTCGVGSVVAIVLGFIARDQIRRPWSRQTGAGMATAGIILGVLGAVFWLVIMIVAVIDSAGSAS
jgi:hypothetical protein